MSADVNAPQSIVAANKSVYGVSFDPFQPERLTTFQEDGVVRLWDIRRLGDPVLLPPICLTRVVYIFHWIKRIATNRMVSNTQWDFSHNGQRRTNDQILGHS